MATLTGFKSVGEQEAANQQSASHIRGQQNPVFVHDEDSESNGRKEDQSDYASPNESSIQSDYLTQSSITEAIENETSSRSSSINRGPSKTWTSDNQDATASDCANQSAPKGTGTEKPQHQSKWILNNVDGRIRSGEITAVLGPSGAGKTSLLNSLFGKYRTCVEGSIKVKGATGKKRLSICNIPQNDYLINSLTTEESLWFASRLKNCDQNFDHDNNIERVIELLGLQRCRNTRIKKLSGGQYKRVSIAQEMLSSPDILVLDEPTSGLDSLTCYRTVKVLRDLVEASRSSQTNPMSIILTIHQPHREVLNLFHSVYVMAVGGQTLYQGPPSEMDNWINSYSGISMPSRNYNPASFLVEIAGEEYGRDPIDKLVSKQREKFKQTTIHNFKYHLNMIPPIKDHFQRSSDSDLSFNNNNNETDSNNYNYTSSSVKPEMENDSNSRSDLFESKDSDTGSDSGEKLSSSPEANNKGKFWSHTVTLAHRTFLTLRRDPLLTTTRLIFHLTIPLLMANIYGRATGAANACPYYESEIDINKVSDLVESKRIENMLEEMHMSIENVSMFFITMYAFAAAVLALNALSFPLSMQVLLKETRNGWYSLSSYVIAKTIADLPLELMMPWITMAMVYPMTGQPDSYLQWRMLTICLIMTLCTLIAQTQALIMGAIFMNSIQTAVFVAQASQLPFVILAGFTIRIKRLPEALKLLSLTSFYRLGNEAIVLARYGFRICPCDDNEITGQPVKLVGIPDHLKRLIKFYLDSEASSSENVEGVTSNQLMTTTIAESNSNFTKPDIFQNIANQLAFANNYGVNITSCNDVNPERIRAINLGNEWLTVRIFHLVIMLVIMKVVLYYALKISVGIRL